MEIITLPAEEVRQLLSDYKQTTRQLIDAQKELAALKEDKYVTWEWVCDYFSISKSTALLMLADEKLFVHGRQIKRFKKSELIRFAERNSIKVRHVASAE